MPALSRRRPGRWACPLRGSRAIRAGWVSLAESPPVPPSRQASHLGARADIKGPGAGRPQQRLVAGEGQQIDEHRLDVDRQDAGGLGGVDQEKQVVFAGQFADLLNRLHRAQDVAGMGLGDEPGLRRDGPANVVRARRCRLRWPRYCASG